MLAQFAKTKKYLWSTAALALLAALVFAASPSPSQAASGNQLAPEFALDAVQEEQRSHGQSGQASGGPTLSAVANDDWTVDLTMSNGPTPWWFRINNASCTQAGSSSYNGIQGYQPGTHHVLAYSDAGCATYIAQDSFTVQPAVLSATPNSDWTVDLRLSPGPQPWYFKINGGGCVRSDGAGYTGISGYWPAVAHQVKAYSDASCSTQLASSNFTLPDAVMTVNVNKDDSFNMRLSPGPQPWWFKINGGGCTKAAAADYNNVRGYGGGRHGVVAYLDGQCAKPIGSHSFVVGPHDSVRSIIVTGTNKTCADLSSPPSKGGSVQSWVPFHLDKWDPGVYDFQITNEDTTSNAHLLFCREDGGGNFTQVSWAAGGKFRGLAYGTHRYALVLKTTVSQSYEVEYVRASLLNTHFPQSKQIGPVNSVVENTCDDVKRGTLKHEIAELQSLASGVYTFDDNSDAPARVHLCEYRTGDEWLDVSYVEDGKWKAVAHYGRRYAVFYNARVSGEASYPTITHSRVDFPKSWRSVSESMGVQVKTKANKENAKPVFVVQTDHPVNETFYVEYRIDGGTAGKSMTHPYDYSNQGGRLVIRPGRTQETVNPGVVNDQVYEAGGENLRFAFTSWGKLGHPNTWLYHYDKTMTVPDDETGPVMNKRTANFGYLSSDLGNDCAEIDDNAEYVSGKWIFWQVQKFPKAFYSFKLKRPHGKHDSRVVICEQKSDGTFKDVAWLKDGAYRFASENDKKYAVGIYSTNHGEFSLTASKKDFPKGVRSKSDPKTYLSFSGASASEGDDLKVKVTLQHALTYPVWAKISAEESSNLAPGVAAQAGVDFSRQTSTAYFYPGETAKTLHFVTKEDGLLEGDEQFTLRITDWTGEVLLSKYTDVATIKDDGDVLQTEKTVGIKAAAQGKDCSDVNSTNSRDFADWMPWQVQFFPDGIYRFSVKNYPAGYTTAQQNATKFYVCAYMPSDSSWMDVTWNDADDNDQASLYYNTSYVVALSAPTGAPAGNFIVKTKKVADIPAGAVKFGYEDIYVHHGVKNNGVGSDTIHVTEDAAAKGSIYVRKIVDRDIKATITTKFVKTSINGWRSAAENYDFTPTNSAVARIKAGEVNGTFDAGVIDDTYDENQRERFGFSVNFSTTGSTTPGKSYLGNRIGYIVIQDDGDAPASTASSTVGDGELNKTCGEVGGAGANAGFLPWERQNWPKGVYKFEVTSYPSGYNVHDKGDFELKVCSSKKFGSWSSIDWKDVGQDVHASLYDDAVYAVLLKAPKKGTFALKATKVFEIDDDAVPYGSSVTLTGSGNADVDEGDSHTHTFTLSHKVDREITATYNVDSGGTGDTAVAGVDYTSVTKGPLRFNPGVTTLTVNAATDEDALREGDETFSVYLTDASGATADETKDTITIKDDDDAPASTVSTTLADADRGKDCSNVASAPHGAKFLPWERQDWPKGTYTFGITSYPGSYDTADRNAVKVKVCSKDSSGTWQSIEWTKDGAANVTLRAETRAAVVLQVPAAQNSGAFTMTYTRRSIPATWQNPATNTPQPALSLSPTSVSEGDDVTATVTLNALYDEPVEYEVKTVHDHLKQVHWFDYPAEKKTITFWPGEQSKSVVFGTSDDGLPELDETVIVMLMIDEIRGQQQHVTLQDKGNDAAELTQTSSVKAADLGKSCADASVSDPLARGYMLWMPQRWTAGIYQIKLDPSSLNDLSAIQHINIGVCRFNSDNSISEVSWSAPGVTGIVKAAIHDDAYYAVVLKGASGLKADSYGFVQKRLSAIPAGWAGPEESVSVSAPAETTVAEGETANVVFTLAKALPRPATLNVKLAAVTQASSGGKTYATPGVDFSADDWTNYATTDKTVAMTLTPGETTAKLAVATLTDDASETKEWIKILTDGNDASDFTVSPETVWIAVRDGGSSSGSGGKPTGDRLK